MARPTKLAAELAREVGEPPSRIQGWIERGLGPASPGTDPAEHFRRLAPLLGTGREDDVAVLKLAADGYPCRRLRELLGHIASDERPDTADPQELVEHLMSDETVADLRRLIEAQARQVPVPKEWASLPESEMPDAERAELIGRTAALSIADLTVGDPDPYFVDLYELNEAAAPTGEPFDDDAAQVTSALFSSIRTLARTSPTWIENASPDELAGGVAAARALIESGVAAVAGLDAWGEEAKWRRIGLLASVAQPVLQTLLAVAGMIPVGTALPPPVRAYLGAIATFAESPGKPVQPPVD
jgi:hypothetical protein